MVTKCTGSGQTATAPRHFTFVNINEDYLTASFVCLVHCSQFINTLLTSTREFISEQLRLRRVCAHAQSRLNLRFSHTQCRIKQKSKLLSPLVTTSWAFKRCPAGPKSLPTVLSLSNACPSVTDPSSDRDVTKSKGSKMIYSKTVSGREFGPPSSLR